MCCTKYIQIALFASLLFIITIIIFVDYVITVKNSRKLCLVRSNMILHLQSKCSAVHTTATRGTGEPQCLGEESEERREMMVCCFLTVCVTHLK